MMISIHDYEDKIKTFRAWQWLPGMMAGVYRVLSCAPDGSWAWLAESEGPAFESNGLRDMSPNMEDDATLGLIGRSIGRVSGKPLYLRKFINGSFDVIHEGGPYSTFTVIDGAETEAEAWFKTFELHEIGEL